MNRRTFLNMAGIVGAGIVIGAPSVAGAASVSRETRVMLGTFVSVTVDDPSAMRSADAMGAAFEECARLDALLSRFRSDTPVAELNRGSCLLDTPDDVSCVLHRAVALNRLTKGAFDITVQPIVDFIAAHRSPSGAMHVDARELDAVKQLADPAALRVEGRRVHFERAGMGITLDGIAKGYIADRMADVLASRHVRGFVVNAGGDIRTGGHKEGGLPWHVAVQDPADRVGRLDTVSMTEGAIATSGGYEQAYDRSGTFTHLVDPASGLSPKTVAGVSVRARTAMDADALATACSVMSAPVAINLVEQIPGCACLIVLSDGRVMRSRGWA